MDLFEYQGKLFFSRYGIPISPGEVAFTVDEAVAAAEKLGYPVVVKAQVLTGGRGKAGGVKLASNVDEAREHATNILGLDIKGHVVHRLWIEKASDIEKEYYASFTLDRAAKKHLGMLSAQGGVEIEQVAREHPEKIVRALADPMLGLQAWQAREVGFRLGLGAEQVGGFAAIAQRLYAAYVAEDATLAEINPLVLTGGGSWVALDSKMSFDDNALFRHPATEALRDMAEENATEVDARHAGISFVKLDGTIGCIVNGAGLAMATMDAVKLHGGEPANFLDVGGGASAGQVAKAFSLVTADPNVRAILINIFGGITRGDVVAQGITEALGHVAVAVPIVVRLSGTNAAEGKQILAAAGLTAVDSMDEAAAAAVRAAA